MKDEYISSNNPVLHCTELQKVFSRRKSDDIMGVKDEYQELIKLPAEDIEIGLPQSHWL